MQHHAYYIEGSLSEFGRYHGELAPFWSKSFDKFGIEDARELVALASLKNYEDVTFLLGISSITSEAQQALLKLFEEPQAGTTFVVLLPHGVLLPTLRSRMLPYEKEQQGGRHTSLASEFLQATGKARSDMVAKLLKDDEGTKERVRDLLVGLEQLLAPRMAEPRVREGLEDIARVRSYVGDRSPSLKMLLEHLALSLPTL